LLAPRAQSLGEADEAVETASHVLENSEEGSAAFGFVHLVDSS
jgi:hypothetical protein